jgi:hypothetical protein
MVNFLPANIDFTLFFASDNELADTVVLVMPPFIFPLIVV